MSKKLQETNAKADPEKTDIPYGNAKVEMGSYLKDLKLEANKK